MPESIHLVKWRSSQEPVTWQDFRNLKSKFKAAVERIKPDLIHAGPIQRVAYLAALIGFHPLLTMSWGYDLLEDAHRDKTWDEITRYVVKNSDWFTSDCQTTKKIALKYGIPESKTTVFPWGVDLGLFNPDGRSFKRREIGYEGDLLIVHTRSWEPRYGVDIALEAFWRALKTESNIHLFLLGGGSQEEKIRQFVSDKDLSDRVHFCGYKQNEELVGFYQAADVYLSASHIDGSSVALLESMACGCPALVSDISANLEWITDKVQGWVFNDGDPENLAEKIIHISRNRNEVLLCGRNARAKAEADADWSKNFPKLLDTYNLMIKR